MLKDAKDTQCNIKSKEEWEILIDNRIQQISNSNIKYKEKIINTLKDMKEIVQNIF